MKDQVAGKDQSHITCKYLGAFQLFLGVQYDFQLSSRCDERRVEESVSYRGYGHLVRYRIPPMSRQLVGGAVARSINDRLSSFGEPLPFDFFQCLQITYVG